MCTPTKALTCTKHPVWAENLVLTVAYMLYMLTLKKITLSLIQLAYMQEICQRLLKLV